MGKKKKRSKGERSTGDRKVMHGNKVIGKVLESYEDDEGLHCVFEVTDKKTINQLAEGALLWL